jgi:hypothetical protein
MSRPNAMIHCCFDLRGRIQIRRRCCNGKLSESQGNPPGLRSSSGNIVSIQFVLHGRTKRVRIYRMDMMPAKVPPEVQCLLNR